MQKVRNFQLPRNPADNFCRHQLITLMIQETHMQRHGIHKIESSSEEKITSTRL